MTWQRTCSFSYFTRLRAQTPMVVTEHLSAKSLAPRQAREFARSCPSRMLPTLTSRCVFNFSGLTRGLGQWSKLSYIIIQWLCAGANQTQTNVGEVSSLQCFPLIALSPSFGLCLLSIPIYMHGGFNSRNMKIAITFKVHLHSISPFEY